ISESSPQPYIIRLFEILFTEHRVNANRVSRVSRRLIKPERVWRTAGDADTREAFGRKERKPTNNALDLFVKGGDWERTIPFSNQSHGGFAQYSVRSAALLPIKGAARRVLGLICEARIP